MACSECNTLADVVGAKHDKCLNVDRAWKHNDMLELLPQLRRDAEGGDAFSQTTVGRYCGNLFKFKDDTNIEHPNYVEALRLLRLAIAQGHSAAQCCMGWMYDSGRGVPQDYTEAVRWYRPAAEQGHAAAQCCMGWMYRHGRGVQQDYAAAACWFRLAAEQGHAAAQYNLGMVYRHGRGVPQDNAEAVRWWRLVAEQGYADAQYNLGLMYHYGLSVSQDDAKAVRWLCLAAEQGHAAAQLSIETLMSRQQQRNVQRVTAQFDPSKDVVAEDGEMDCIICMTNRAQDIVSTSCGHARFCCNGCANRLRGKCPMCKSEGGFIPLYDNCQ